MAFKLDVKVPILKRGYHRETLGFGYTYSNGTFHKGVDFTGSTSVNDGYDDVVAFADGKVVNSQNTISGTISSTGTAGMGNYVIIEHANGWRTRYMHMAKGSVTVKAGASVKAGQTIGRIGNTGNSSGRHLHFDLSNSSRQSGSFSSGGRYYVDPTPYLTGEKYIVKPPESKLGTYVTTADLNVRTGPGTNYDVVPFKDFSYNAQSQVRAIDPKKPNHFPAGMKLTISEVKGTWGKCPTGWVSLNFCKKVSN